MNATEGVVRQAVAEQARVWLIANREQGSSEEHRREFLAWLQASPLNVREYLAIAKLSVELRTAAADVEMSTAELIEAARYEPSDNVAVLPMHNGDTGREKVSSAAPGRTHRVLALAAAVTALALGAISWWSITQLPSHKTYSTAHGEQRIVRLEDGSVLHVNSESIVTVDYSKTERGISMERGQALFKVAKDKSRPFRVRAGAAEVVAVGTEFDVRRLSDDIVVTVVEGAVAVAKIDEQSAAGSAEPVSPVQIAAGQQMRVASGSAPRVQNTVNVRAVDVRPSVAWVQQKVMFERETLQNVAAEFNRYGATQLVIEDSQAATLRISGIFNAYDLESFVLYLESVNGLKVQRDLNRVRISLARNNDGETT